MLVQVDDSIALQVVTRMHVAGYEVDWASSEYEAELSLRYQCHDVVLLDFGDLVSTRSTCRGVIAGSAVMRRSSP